MKYAAFVMALSLCCSVLAQTQEDVPAAIQQEREILSKERARITQLHDQLSKACWQKFAVNDCLTAVRRSRRAALDPLHQKELALNALERDWRTRERLERLQIKATEGGVRLEQ